MNKQTKLTQDYLKSIPDYDATLEIVLENKELYRINEELNNVINDLEVTIHKLTQQPAQEPVAWTAKAQLDYKQKGFDEAKIWFTGNESKNIPLYTHPAPLREPLYFALTKDHTWISITEQQYDKLNPDYRMKVCTYENT